MRSGIVFDIKKYSIHDGPGIRTTVFLQGCPLSCSWCHNPESQTFAPFVQYHAKRCIGCESCVAVCPEDALTLTKDHGIHTDLDKCCRCAQCTEACPTEGREVVGKTRTVDDIVAAVEKDVLFYDESGGGVTFSGGEPLSQPEFLLALLHRCGELGIHRAVDTSGYASRKVLLRVASDTDLFLFDLKQMDSERHRQVTGVPNERILANLRLLAATGVEIHVRIPLIPGVNDDDDNIDRTAAFVESLARVRNVAVLPFHDFAKSKHEKFGMPWRLNGSPAIPAERVERIRSRIARHGLQVKIGG